MMAKARRGKKIVTTATDGILYKGISNKATLNSDNFYCPY